MHVDHRARNAKWLLGLSREPAGLYRNYFGTIQVISGDHIPSLPTKNSGIATVGIDKPGETLRPHSLSCMTLREDLFLIIHTQLNTKAATVLEHQHAG